MSAEMMVRAWKTPGLNPSERLVLLALADCSDREGMNAYRSEQTIAEHTLLALRTVKRSVQGLKLKGLIAVQELPTNRRATTYQLFPREAIGGDRATPKASRATGDRLSPRTGDNETPRTGDSLTPLGVTSRVTSRVPNLQVPPTPPYKEDPVDPVDPGIVSLLAKVVHEFWNGTPDLDGDSLLDSVRRHARARRWPHDARTVSQAVDLARGERQRRAS